MSLHYTESNSYRKIFQIDKQKRGYRYILLFALLFLVFLFLPWTQNVRSTGKVTTLRQEQRPQNINAIIPGRIVRWYVKEGDMVKAGDTILQLGEIKDDYLDPELLNRTGEQLLAKKQSIEFYMAKTNALSQQRLALEQARNYKLAQIENKQQQQQLKIKSDSASWGAAQNDYMIAQKQFNRQKELFDQGLVSLTQLEQRNMSLQSARAKWISTQNNYNNAQQELMNLMLEYKQVQQDYTEKLSKVESDLMQNGSSQAGSIGDQAKLRNQYSNYEQRRALYFVIAPQDGQIVQAKRSGIG
ncbi:MAG: biotin/lipoyl-binding protein [Chitinophagaceae bacterium]|nr:biotin/lipoyl-binding protein [Chitinophagaceae bacterium]